MITLAHVMLCRIVGTPCLIKEKLNNRTEITVPLSPHSGRLELFTTFYLYIKVTGCLYVCIYIVLSLYTIIGCLYVCSLISCHRSTDMDLLYGEVTLTL